MPVDGITSETLLVAGTILLYLVKTIFTLSRTNKYLNELLRRENARSLSRCNEVVKSLTEIFLREPVPTLKDLVEATEASFRVTSYDKPSGENE
jgi:hypothetical protein